jgi:hypothetical protein
MSPAGTRQAISPVLRSIATSSPYGGLNSGSDGMRPSKPSGAGGVNVALPLRPIRSASTSDARGFDADRSGSTTLTTNA